MRMTDIALTIAKPITLPLDDAQVRELHVGQMVQLSGTICTARDAVHRYLAAGGECTCDLNGGVIYHCGPVVVPDGDGWRVTAAGPTTSAREEPYMSKLIERFALRAVIGKGGMGQGTLAACQKFGCVYLHAVGGAAQVLAETIVNVKDVHLKEQFGSPEAIWELEVRDFPALVTMDSHGGNLHADVEQHARVELARLVRK